MTKVINKYNQNKDLNNIRQDEEFNQGMFDLFDKYAHHLEQQTSEE